MGKKRHLSSKAATMTTSTKSSASVAAKQTRRNSIIFYSALAIFLAVAYSNVSAFTPSLSTTRFRFPTKTTTKVRLQMAQASEQDAKVAIDAVVKALRSDAAAKKELGKLNKVENVLGYGSPQKGKLAVRFNASFQKGGSGFLGFGSLGGNKNDDKNANNKPENQRGTMVGQVKASVDQTSGKVIECSVFRDLGYGRSFNLKTR